MPIEIIMFSVIAIAIVLIILILISNNKNKIDDSQYTEKTEITKEQKVKRIHIAVGCLSMIICLLIGLHFANIYIREKTSPIAVKPIIYLYPTEEKEVTVKLGSKENITCSYPNYDNDGWRVLAKPNGDLVDLDDGRNLYALYYENNNNVKFKIEDEGFVVESSQVKEFLEEKLDILGLNEREAEEFIVYWLPRLQSNKYNYIRFATKEEINQNMGLEVSGNPDTIIRVLMTYKGLDKPIQVKEQKIETPERKGFVVVEWGGTEIK